MRHPAVSAVPFRNDCDRWNREPEKYPDGLYLGLTVQTASNAVWTVDIWVVDEPDRQPDLAHLKTLMPRITDEHRATILRIKQVLASRPPDVRALPSVMVYWAVVDHGIRTAEEFGVWSETADA